MEQLFAVGGDYAQRDNEVDGFETIFNLPPEPARAAPEILETSKGLDEQKHSKLTCEEVREKFSSKMTVRFTTAEIRKLL